MTTVRHPAARFSVGPIRFRQPVPTRNGSTIGGHQTLLGHRRRVVAQPDQRQDRRRAQPQARAPGTGTPTPGHEKRAQAAARPNPAPTSPIARGGIHTGRRAEPEPSAEPGRLPPSSADSLARRVRSRPTCPRPQPGDPASMCGGHRVNTAGAAVRHPHKAVICLDHRVVEQPRACLNCGGPAIRQTQKRIISSR